MINHFTELLFSRSLGAIFIGFVSQFDICRVCYIRAALRRYWRRWWHRETIISFVTFSVIKCWRDSLLFLQYNNSKLRKNVYEIHIHTNVMSVTVFRCFSVFFFIYIKKNISRRNLYKFKPNLNNVSTWINNTGVSTLWPSQHKFLTRQCLLDKRYDDL